MVAEGRIAPGTRLVRVYSGSMKRPWLTTPEEIDGLTDRQIQDKLALPAPPSRIVDVNADGLKARCGYARENYGQKGGGLQIELLDDPESAIFINDRNL